VVGHRCDDTQISQISRHNGEIALVVERAQPGCFELVNFGTTTLSNRKTLSEKQPSGPQRGDAWADLNGNGTTDLIYADSTSVPRIQAVDIGRLINSGSIPNTLIAITNGIGRITLIGYQPSTSFALADAAEGKSMAGSMPFPVQVVASLTNLDSLGHQYVSRFRYHNGYYDPARKAIPRVLLASSKSMSVISRANPGHTFLVRHRPAPMNP